MFEYNVLYMCCITPTRKGTPSENSNYINSDTMKINSNEFIGLCDVAKELFFSFFFVIKERAISCR